METDHAEALSKTAFFRACRKGDLPIVQQYIAQPSVSRLTLALERTLNDGSSRDNIREASRTMMAASRGLWFSGSHSDDGDVFCAASVNHQVEVLQWFFSSQFSKTIPITLQVIFLQLTRRVVARADWEIVELLLSSWVFRFAMAQTTQEWVLSTLRMEARAHNLPADLLIAHGSVEPLDDSSNCCQQEECCKSVSSAPKDQEPSSV